MGNRGNGQIIQPGNMIAEPREKDIQVNILMELRTIKQILQIAHNDALIAWDEKQKAAQAQEIEKTQ